MGIDFTGSTLALVLVLFAVGLICIIKGGDLFVDAATWIAEASGIPKFIIGATVVSFATTMPEMLVSVFSAFEGNSDIAVGNAVGSVTANTGLIMCLSLVCMSCYMTRKQFGVKAGLLLAAVVLLFAFTRDSALSVSESIIIMLVFVGFMVESILAAKREQGSEAPDERPSTDGKSVAINIGKFILGAAAIVVSGIMLKKTKMFAGDPAPFVMELPAYHVPKAVNILRGTWERGWSFIKRAGTVILLSSIILWFLQGFGFVDGAFGMVEDNNSSLLASIGRFVAPIFAPLGFGSWKPAVASFTGLIAKENVVGTFGVLYGFAKVAEDGQEIWANIGADFTALTAYSFMIFNLLCAPCFAAMGAIKREMNNGKWTLGAIGYMCGFAYLVSLMVYQFGRLFTGGGFGVGTVAALVVLAGFLYLLFRKAPTEEVKGNLRSVASSRAGD